MIKIKSKKKTPGFVPAKSKAARQRQQAAIRKYYSKKKSKKEKKKTSQILPMNFPHFRRYKAEEGSESKIARHPKLIMSKEKEEFEFIGLTEAPKRGHHKNIPLTVNPETGNFEKSYLRDELRKLPTRRFGEPLSDYKLSEEDEKTAWEIYHKNKKK